MIPSLDGPLLASSSLQEKLQYNAQANDRVLLPHLHMVRSLRQSGRLPKTLLILVMRSALLVLRPNLWRFFSAITMPSSLTRFRIFPSPKTKLPYLSTWFERRLPALYNPSKFTAQITLLTYLPNLLSHNNMLILPQVFSQANLHSRSMIQL